jgi:regulator of nucleoside diphosphate kinase
MKYGHLILKFNEFGLLMEILEKAFEVDEVSVACYRKLKRELMSAECVDADKLPSDVISMGSKFDVLTPYGEIKGYQLVYPGEQNVLEKKISVLSPMGSALIGYAQSDDVLWTFPGGLKKITITKVVNQRSGATKRF